MRERTIGEGGLARLLLTGAALAFVGVLLVLPLVAVFYEAGRAGGEAFLAAITDPDAWAAVRLTLLVAAVVVPCNALFGLAAAWCIARFRFPFRHPLTLLIALPFSISPVVAGLVWVLLFGRQGWFGPLLAAADISVVFALPGILLATVFVTLPLVAGQLIPLLESQGIDEEEAALTLGASGWQMFWFVSLPKLRWGLLYGVLLCNARAMGEFGAVSVVSGHIRGVTNTIPLHVEALYNEYAVPAAFAVSTLLATMALVTIALRSLLEWREARTLAAGAAARLDLA